MCQTLPSVVLCRFPEREGWPLLWRRCLLPTAGGCATCRRSLRSRMSGLRKRSPTANARQAFAREAGSRPTMESTCAERPRRVLGFRGHPRSLSQTALRYRPAYPAPRRWRTLSRFVPRCHSRGDGSDIRGMAADGLILPGRFGLDLAGFAARPRLGCHRRDWRTEGGLVRPETRLSPIAHQPSGRRHERARYPSH